jgi:hypothetical protein
LTSVFISGGIEFTVYTIMPKITGEGYPVPHSPGQSHFFMDFKITDMSEISAILGRLFFVDT